MSRLSTILALWLPLAACTYASGDPRVMVTSTPAGADVLIDGRPTGQTTPVMLDLDGIIGSDHVISVQKDGFDPAERDVVHYSHWYTSRWIDGTDLRVFAFPFFWTLGDFITPFAVKWQYVPHEVHMQLYPEGQGPVSAPPPDVGGGPERAGTR